MARFLLGHILVHDIAGGRIAGRIVETEAYLPDDPGSHAFRGRTKRNASMFLERGFAYVYQIYGTSFCLNVSSEAGEIGAAVLLRALEPLTGLEHMKQRRGTVRERDLARGPGRLTRALGIGPEDDGRDLCTGTGLWLGRDDFAGVVAGVSTRVGLSKAVDAPLRFYIPGSVHVSGPKKLSPLH